MCTQCYNVLGRLAGEAKIILSAVRGLVVCIRFYI